MRHGDEKQVAIMLIMMIVLSLVLVVVMSMLYVVDSRKVMAMNFRNDAKSMVIKLGKCFSVSRDFAIFHHIFFFSNFLDLLISPVCENRMHVSCKIIKLFP